MSELTIRCPSCNAVMPALNSGCISCGQPFDPTARVMLAIKLLGVVADAGPYPPELCDALLLLGRKLLAVTASVKKQGVAKLSYQGGDMLRKQRSGQYREEVRGFLHRVSTP